MNQRWANIKSSELREPRAGEQFYFNIPMNEDPIAQKVPIQIKVSGYVTSGWLRFELRNPTGQAVWDSGIIKSGDYAITTEYAVPTGATGTYTLGLVYGANTQAVYNLGWRAIRLRPIIILTGAVLVMVGLVSIIYIAWQKKSLVRARIRGHAEVSHIKRPDELV